MISWAAIFVASLVGSLHCVGMCGGFVATVAGAGPGRRHQAQAMLAYQSTRGAMYGLLGALAGLVGAGLDRGGTLLGLQQIAGPLMGISLIVLAIVRLAPSEAQARDSGLIGLGQTRRVGLLARARSALARSLRERGLRAAAAAGLLTALLPCGWLWAYLLVAASTGSPLAGTFAMLVFWAGTLPALFGVGLLAGEIGRRLGRHAPRISAAVLLTLGLLSLAGKLGPTPVAEPDPEPESMVIHEPSSAPSDAPCH